MNRCRYGMQWMPQFVQSLKPFESGLNFFFSGVLHSAISQSICLDELQKALSMRFLRSLLGIDVTKVECDLFSLQQEWSWVD